jgi:hypothetical protein
MNRDDVLARIKIDPNICFGKPCIRGHRVWVSLVLDSLASAWSRSRAGPVVSTDDEYGNVYLLLFDNPTRPSRQPPRATHRRNEANRILQLVPTVPVGMPSWTLCVRPTRNPDDAERRGLHSHGGPWERVSPRLRTAFPPNEANHTSRRSDETKPMVFWGEWVWSFDQR